MSEGEVRWVVALGWLRLRRQEEIYRFSHVFELLTFDRVDRNSLRLLYADEACSFLRPTVMDTTYAFFAQEHTQADTLQNNVDEGHLCYLCQDYIIFICNPPVC